MGFTEARNLVGMWWQDAAGYVKFPLLKRVTEIFVNKSYRKFDRGHVAASKRR